MFQSDIVGVAAVYIYVIVLIVFTEKVFSKRYPVQSRKFLHIMTGNIAFILPLFVTREVMAFVAAGPFILFTFLMSPYSPITSMRGKTSEAGHGMGLVYYAISWTILAYIFFDHMVVIAIAIFAMSYGDGFASLLGMKFGKRKYKIFGDQKSYFGSISMFIFTLAMIVIAFLYYGLDITSYKLLIIAFIAMAAAIIEAITPRGLDNLSVPLSISAIYWFLLIYKS
ncbi:MAG: SEC59/DGK1/VTE5 family protein [Euryarchaeota archaeon]|nr:SEC59/DGK1/VTE5 family protein [Euryarchaeota archaeon]